jgi:hypothetical protein
MERMIDHYESRDGYTIAVLTCGHKISDSGAKPESIFRYDTCHDPECRWVCHKCKPAPAGAVTD